MFRIRRVFVQRLLSHRSIVGIECFQAPINDVVKVRTNSTSTIVSRSRPTLSGPGPTRLPAAVAPPKDTKLFSSLPSLSDDDVKRKVEEITDKYKEAMDLLDDVRSSIGTVYLSEDMTDAENAIQEVLLYYETLLKQMNDDQKRSVVRTIGLKIEELKAQSEMLKDSLKDHR